MHVIARHWLAGLALSFLGWTSALAQVNPEYQMVGIRGTCEKVFVAGTGANCTGTGILYSHHPNGVVLIQTQLPGRLLAFVGEKDSQPNPREYHLYLSRARVETGGSSFVATVAGQCVIRMSEDGRIWHRVDCDATDENNRLYRLRFVSDGEPVHVSRVR
jgi:hypothetical protein